MPAVVSSQSSSSTEIEHWTLVQDLWKKIDQLRDNGKVVIDGESLDVASTVAVSRCDKYL